MADRTVRVRLEAAVAGFTASMAQAQASAKSMGNDFGQMARTNQAEMRMLGTTMAVAGGAIVGGLAMSVRAAGNFEESMNRVGALTQATGDDFDALSDLALELGRTTMFSASEAADGMGFLAQAGFEVDEILSAMPSTLALAAAGQLDLASAADIASNVLQGFGLEAAEIERVNDVMAATSSDANTSVGQLGEAFSYVAPLANAAGMEIEEVGSLIGAMSDAGIQAGRAGTSLVGMLAALEDQGGPAAQAFEDMGLATHNAAGELRPMADIIEDLEARGLSAGEAISIFGRRAGPGVSALLEIGSDSLREFEGNLENSAGRAQEMADRQMEGLNGSLKEFSSATEGAAIALGSTLSPAFEVGVDGATALMSAFAGMPEAAQGTIAVVGGIAGVALTAGGAFLMLAPRVVATKDAIQTLGPVAQGAARGMGQLARLGGVAVVLTGVAVAADTLSNSIVDLIDPIAGVDDMALALEGLAVKGQIPDSVAGSLDGIGEALERIHNPTAIQGLNDTFANFPFMSGEAERLEERVAGLDDALAQAAASGNDAALAAGMEILEDVAADLGMSLDDLIADYFPEYAKAADAAALDSSDAGVAMSGLADDLDGVATAADEAAASVDDFTQSIDDMISGQLAVEEAADRVTATIGRFRDQVEEATEAGGKNATALDGNSKAALANRDMLRRLVGDIGNHIRAQAEQGASSEDLQATLSEERARLLDVMEQLGFNRDEASRYIDVLDLIPTDVDTAISNNADAVVGSVERYRAAIDRIPSEKRTNLVSVYSRIDHTGHPAAGAPRSHSGGWAGQGVRRYHGGGVAGGDGASLLGPLAPNELPAILERGEFIVQASEAPKHAPLLQAINDGRMHDGGAVGGQIAYGQPAQSAGGTRFIKVEMPVHLDGRKVGKSHALVDTLRGQVVTRGRETAGSGWT